MIKNAGMILSFVSGCYPICYYKVVVAGSDGFSLIIIIIAYTVVFWVFWYGASLFLFCFRIFLIEVF